MYGFVLQRGWGVFIIIKLSAMWNSSLPSNFSPDVPMHTGAKFLSAGHQPVSRFRASTKERSSPARGLALCWLPEGGWASGKLQVADTVPNKLEATFTDLTCKPLESQLTGWSFSYGPARGCLGPYAASWCNNHSETSPSWW